jgi:hypothetical protein
LANISISEVQLLCHPQSDASGVTGIDVNITRVRGGRVKIVYRVSGAVGELEIPVPFQPDRVDGLWKNTCFEIFMARSPDKIYLEYNFSPSSHWAAYQFSDYRHDMADAATVAPDISLEQDDAVLIISATLQIPDEWQESDLQVGLSAILATKSGNMSYWALAHPQDQPDFHHKDCFALQLEAPSAA